MAVQSKFYPRKISPSLLKHFVIGSSIRAQEKEEKEKKGERRKKVFLVGSENYDGSDRRGFLSNDHFFMFGQLTAHCFPTEQTKKSLLPVFSVSQFFFNIAFLGLG